MRSKRAWYKLKIDGRWRERSAGTTNYRDAKKIRRKWLGDREKLVAHQTWRIDKERLKPL